MIAIIRFFNLGALSSAQRALNKDCQSGPIANKPVYIYIYIYSVHVSGSAHLKLIKFKAYTKDSLSKISYIQICTPPCGRKRRSYLAAIIPDAAGLFVSKQAFQKCINSRRSSRAAMHHTADFSLPHACSVATLSDIRASCHAICAQQQGLSCRGKAFNKAE